MVFQKGNKVGNRFGRDNQPINKGRKKRSERVKAFIEAVDTDPLTADELNVIDRILLALPREQLVALCEKDDLPAVVTQRAQHLLTDGFEATERMADRAFGKPTQRAENFNAVEFPDIDLSFLRDAKV